MQNKFTWGRRYRTRNPAGNPAAGNLVWCVVFVVGGGGWWVSVRGYVGTRRVSGAYCPDTVYCILYLPDFCFLWFSMVSYCMVSYGFLTFGGKWGIGKHRNCTVPVLRKPASRGTDGRDGRTLPAFLSSYLITQAGSLFETFQN